MPLFQSGEISLDGYQVVNKELFQNNYGRHQITMTMWPNAICFSKSAIVAMNSCQHIRLHISKTDKTVLIGAATEKDPNSIKWVTGLKEVNPRKLDCPKLAAPLYQKWNLDKVKVYKTIGEIVVVDKKVMLLFNYDDAESWKYGKES